MSKAQSETMTIRMPTDVKAAVAKQAERNTRTIANQIIYYVKQGLEADGVTKNELGHLGLRDKK